MGEITARFRRGARWMRSARDAVAMAVESLRAHHVRGALSAGGLMMGVSAIILLAGLGQGLRSHFHDRFAPLATQIEVDQVSGAAAAGLNTRNLTESDVAALDEQAGSTIAAVTPVLTGSLTVRHQGTWAAGSVVGSAPDYISVTNRSIQAGRAFTDREQTASARVTVLGPVLAGQLFGRDVSRALGQRVRLGRISFTVIGVFAADGQNDSVAFMPLTTAQDTVIGRGNKLGKIIVTATNQASVDAAVTKTQQVLFATHHISNPLTMDFKLTAKKDFLARSELFTTFLGWFVLGSAGLSLLVGGVGVANVMLVSVTERTREIGIRRAVGARRAEITRQFLTEAVTLAGMGGLGGVVVGVTATVAANVVLSLAAPDYGLPEVSPLAVVSSFVVALVIGVTAGWYPARRAARLAPIDALRHE